MNEAGLMAPILGEILPFELAADIDNRSLPRLQPTTIYLVDDSARIQQVFPMETYSRANWWAVLREVDRLIGGD